MARLHYTTLEATLPNARWTWAAVRCDFLIAFLLCFTQPARHGNVHSQGRSRMAGEAIYLPPAISSNQREIHRQDCEFVGFDITKIQPNLEFLDPGLAARIQWVQGNV